MELIYFFSDAHFGADVEKEAERRQRFYEFLDQVAVTGKALYIIGDLFDFWFEYGTVIPKHAYPILHRLSRLIEQGVELHYFAGNHDLWLGEFIRHELGADVHDGPLSINLHGLRFYLVHGDGLAPSDWSYRLMKRVFRNRVNIVLFRWLHPDLGVPLARALSKKSRAKGENRREAEYIDFARRKLAEGYDAVVMGHTHLPRQDRFDEGIYINLGDWMDHFTYAVLRDGVLSLRWWMDDLSAARDEKQIGKEIPDRSLEGNRIVSGR